MIQIYNMNIGLPGSKKYAVVPCKLCLVLNWKGIEI